MRKIFLVIASIAFLNNAYAQTQISKVSERGCTVGDSIPYIFEVDKHSNFVGNSNARLNDLDGVIIIPVVFHILYDPNQPFDPNIPSQNISNQRIYEQLSILNEDFRKLNTDINSIPYQPWANIAADFKFEFRLACIDPDGNPTTGITRFATNNPNEFCGLTIPPTSVIPCPDAQLPPPVGYGVAAWKTDQYLNIWVCSRETIGGTAMLPQNRFGTYTIPGTSNTYQSSVFDGIVLDYRTVGQNGGFPNFNSGRLLTHEVGHWLGLWHTYKGGCATLNDEVDDTPATNPSPNNCAQFPFFGCNPQVFPGTMFMNYMDNGNDGCKYMFTEGQKTRARSFFSSTGPLGTRFPFLENYFSIKKELGNPHIVQNNTITVKLNNPACLDVTLSFSGPVTVISQDNQKIVFSVACPSSGTVNLTVNSMNPSNPSQFGNYIDDYSFNFNNTQCNSCQAPIVTPGGPINYYIPLDGICPSSMTFTSNSSTGNQWYKNNQLIPGATNQSLNIGYNTGQCVPVSGEYYTVVNGCASNIVTLEIKNYGYGWYGEEQYNFGATFHPANSPGFYCLNSNDKIKNIDIGSNTTYTWYFTNLTNPANPANISLNASTYNPSSPVADVIIGGDPYTGTLAKGVADRNGTQTIIDYLIYQSPFINPVFGNNYSICLGQTANINLITSANSGFYPQWQYIKPGGSNFDWEEYEFGPNSTILNYTPIPTNPQIVRVPGGNQQSQPIQVQFSGNSYVHKRFYNNNSTDGCAQENFNVIVLTSGCFGKEENSNNIISVYPNPANTHATFSSKFPISRIEVFDNYNSLKKIGYPNQGLSTTIDVSDLKFGIYSCRVITHKKVEYIKLLIQR